MQFERRTEVSTARCASSDPTAVKRVTIVEPRGLGSRVRSEGTRARAIGESLATSKKRSDTTGDLRCLSEPGHALRVFWVGERINHLVRKPNAGKLHVRFDERDLETEDMVSYSGTGIPKGPAHRVRLNLTPPRQISTLPPPARSLPGQR